MQDGRAVIKDFVVVDILDEQAASCKQGERGIIGIEGVQKVLAGAYNALSGLSRHPLTVEGVITSIKQTDSRWAFARLRDIILTPF